jgi:osmotically inducible protein OsmC
MPPSHSWRKSYIGVPDGVSGCPLVSVDTYVQVIRIRGDARMAGIASQSEGNDMIRKARAVWRGTGRDGSGTVSTDSGVLSNTFYTFKTRFEEAPGTNPEELIAAAHAGCFSMALAFQLQRAGYISTELDAEAAVTLDPDGQGYRISRSALTLRAIVPGLDEATFARLAREAKDTCPVSRVLNADIALYAQLA